MWAWWKLNVPKSYELICRSCFPHERWLHPGRHPQSLEVRRWRRSGLGGTSALYSWQCLASAKGSEARIPCSVAFPNAAQLGARAYCINGTYWAKKEIHNFVKVVDHNLPVLPSPFKIITPHTNSSNRYRLYAYFSHSSISNAYVKGPLIYVYQLCGALLLGNVIILMVFLLYSKVANEAYCKKVIDFHWVKM